MSRKEIIIVGGPNGAGKSTMIAAFLKERSCPYLCADVIASEFSNLEPSSQQFASGREFLLRIENQLSKEEDFILESTLSGRTLRSFLARARAVGYSITIAFIYLDSADTCVARVQERVRRGGTMFPKGMSAAASCEAARTSGKSIDKLLINGF